MGCGECVGGWPFLYLSKSPHSARCLHLNDLFRIYLQVLRNHKFHRISIDSLQMEVKSVSQGILPPSVEYVNDSWGGGGAVGGRLECRNVFRHS